MKRVLLALPLLALLLLSACQKSQPEPTSTGDETVKEQSQSLSETEGGPSTNDNQTPSSQNESSNGESAPNNAQNQEQKTALGWIEGSVSYPSEGLPDGLEVCALQVEEGNNMYCTSQWIEDEKYTYGFGYKLAVPAGTYQVMAQRSGGGLMGWYSAFVTCGETVECTDHTPLNVEVKAGEGVEEIDPGDWYQ